MGYRFIRPGFIIGVLLVLFVLNTWTVIGAMDFSGEVVDLRGRDLERELSDLHGLWELYWGQLLEPDDVSKGISEITGVVDVPRAWNGYQYQGQVLPGQGYATYRVIIKVDETDEVMGIYVPRILTAYRLWVDGHELASAGQVGTNIEESNPQYLPQQAFFYPEGETVEVIMQVSNFHHRSGGILQNIQFGTATEVMVAARNKIAYDIFLFGSLFIMALYHLILFFFRKAERSLLYFGLFCLLLSFRTLLVGEIFLIQIFPGFDWELAHKVQTLSFYFGVYVVLMFFKSVFPGYISKIVVQISSIVVIAFGLLVLFTPARIFTEFNHWYQLFTLILALYIITVLFRVIKHREAGAFVIAFGAAVLIATGINDMLFLSILMSDHHVFRAFITTGNLSSLGLLVFVLTHSLVLAVKYSKTFEKNEAMALELMELNEGLESIVDQRTKDLVTSKARIEQQKQELEEANNALTMLSLKDPLTDLWNRRHFDKALNIEWRRASRHEYCLTLLFIDIDDFKPYNDEYGHSAGDECLKKVAEVMKMYIRRAEDVVARYGGEEFVVLLPNTHGKSALKVAEQLRAGVERLEVPHARLPYCGKVTISIGIASVIPNSNLSPEGLVRAADKAMYRAKQKGKNRIEL